MHLFGQVMHEGSMTLLTAYLYVTLRCNARCGFCRMWREQTDAPPDMSLDTGQRILEDLRRLGVKHVDFTGGEPTLYGPLPELLRHANSLGLFTSVTSNGLLYQRRAEEIQGLPYSLGFSLNGPNAELHDAVQGVKSFDKALASIRLARSLGEPVHAHFTATADNISQLDDMVQLAEGLDVPLVVFPEFSYFGNNRLDAQHLDKLARMARSPHACVNLASVEFQRNGGNDVERPVCTAGRSAIAIGPDAAILLPCFHNRRYRIPTEGHLLEVYRSPDVQRILQWSGRLDACRGCTNWCYINPSLALRRDRYGLLHTAAAVKRLRGSGGDPWLRRTRRVLLNRISPAGRTGGAD